MRKPTIYLLANAHLDPVWLWDWREGLNEGVQTCRTVLDLMEDNPTLTFIRGESMIYRHIQQYDPKTFSRIRTQVESGRWDVVGGTLIQADNNLPCTEVLLRQFEAGQNYFRQTFGKTVRAAWSADAFGHSAGLPEILAASGIDSFAFTRPMAPQLPLENAAFWWEGSEGSRILAYRPVTAYLSDRTNAAALLDQILKEALENPLRLAGFFYGIGDHGGGPTRKLLDDIAEWARVHPEVDVVFSGLHGLFEAIRAASREQNADLPIHRGELGFCLRGCYSSMARFKFAYRKAEARLIRSEHSSTIINAHLNRSGECLDSAWESLLFCSFHDILPGSSIERAMREQQSWLGSIDHASQKAELDMLTSLGTQIDTTVLAGKDDHPSPVPLLVWNPHPHAFEGNVEIEVCLDYRPIWSYQHKPASLPVRITDGAGTVLPYQEIPTEHNFMTDLPWRKRLVVPVTVSAMGWTILEYGWVEGAKNPALPSRLKSDGTGTIENEFYRLEAKVGQEAIHLWQEGIPVFAGPGMSMAVFDDPWGSWGGLSEEDGSLDISTQTEGWKVTQVRVMECGPERVALWVRFAGESSHLDLTFQLARGRKAVDVKARLFWQERQSRLKIQFPCGDHATFEVPGGTATRGPGGEVPGGRWVRVKNGERLFGFASDSLYNFDLKDGLFRATILRSAGFATNELSPGWNEPWRPVGDGGEHVFQFLIQTGDGDLPRLSAELERPPIVQQLPASPGSLPRRGSLMRVEPAGLRILGMATDSVSKGVVVRTQADENLQGVIHWLGARLELGLVPAGRILSWSILRRGDSWTVQPLGS